MTSNVDMLIFVFEDSCRIQLKMSLQLKLNYLGMGHKSLILARCMIVPLLCLKRARTCYRVQVCFLMDKTNF